MQHRRRAVAAVAAVAVAATTAIATTQGATATPRPAVSIAHAHVAAMGTFVADPAAVQPSSQPTLTSHLSQTGVTPQALFTWGWITGTVYFNKRETSLIAALAGAGSYVAPLIPGWGYLVGAHLAAIAAAAAIAATNQRCLKIKIPSLSPGSYTGGYCR